MELITNFSTLMMESSGVMKQWLSLILHSVSNSSGDNNNNNSIKTKKWNQESACITLVR